MTIRSLCCSATFALLMSHGAGAQPSLRHTADPISDMLQHVSDSSYASYVKGLEAFGTRHARQANRDSVASWIAVQFQSAGLTDVATDSFTFDTTRQWNIIATLMGSQPFDGEIVMGAHYDSQSLFPWAAPGADDNASGTAAVLEIARALRAASYVPRHTLRFVAFGAEEMGLIGSEWYASRLAYEGRTVSLMLNFDMIGTRRADQTDRDVNMVWYDGAYDEARLDSALFRTYTTLTPILTTQYRTQSDSWPFARRGIKSVFHIERDFSTVYHTPNDSSTRLDFAYATDIVRGGLAMLLASDGASATGLGGQELLPETWSLEQNYPNPFNGETIIRYRVAGNGDAGSGGGGWVSLRIFDVLGREVDVLANGQKDAGVYTVTWNSAGRPSGMYLARLELTRGLERASWSKSMLLLK